MSSMNRGENEVGSNPLRPATSVLRSWPVRIYLAVVAVAAVFVIWTEVTAEQTNTNMAGIWLILPTLPWSLIAAWLFADSGSSSLEVVFYVSIAAGALINASLIDCLRLGTKRS